MALGALAAKLALPVLAVLLALAPVAGRNFVEASSHDSPQFPAQTATRQVVENTPAGWAIGLPVPATNPKGGELTYSLGGTDAAYFDLDATTGQLLTDYPLDYESENSYTVTITATDSAGDTGSRVVAIAVTNVNEPPEFRRHNPTIRVAENTGLRQPVGDPVDAIDPEGDRLFYALVNGDLDMFSINSSTGQILTKAPLDYESKDEYWLHVAVRDGKGSGGWTDLVGDTQGLVVIGVTNADDPGEVTLNWRRPQVGASMEASLTDPDGETSNHTWQWAKSSNGSTNWADISGATASSYVPVAGDVNNYLRVTVTYTDPEGAGKTAPAVSPGTVRTQPQSVSSPVFSDGGSATRSIMENSPPGVNVGGAVTATASDGQELRYTLEGTHAPFFNINPRTGQIMTKASLDHEEDSSRSVTVKAAVPSGGSATTNVTIDVADQPVEITGPYEVSFPEGDYVYSRVVGSYTIEPASARLTLTGRDASHFSIGGLNALTFNSEPNYEAPSDSGRNNVYEVTINAAAGANQKTHNVRVRVTDSNEAPVITGSTQVTYVEGTTGPVARYTATDPERDAIRWHVQDTDDFAYFQISRSGVLSFKEPPDYEIPQDSGQDNLYEVVILAESGMNWATEGKRVHVTVTDAMDPPDFSGGKTQARGVAENTPANEPIGQPVSAEDRQGDQVTYTLRGSYASFFTIDPSTGQLKTKSPLNHEARSAYPVRVRASDGSLAAEALVTVVVTNEDEEGVVRLSSTRARANAPFTATLTDPDGGVKGKTWQWGLSDTQNGQYSTISGATLETYTPEEEDVGKYLRAEVDYADNHGLDKSAQAEAPGTVREGVNRPPAFPGQGASNQNRMTASITRDVAENIAAGIDIGAPVSAEDLDGDVLTYSLQGRNAASFDIVASSGQLRTKAPLNYEAKRSYSVAVRAADGEGASAATTVTINVTNVEEGGSVTLSSSQPRAGSSLTASVNDPDGGVTSTTWQWASSGAADGTYTDISGATSASYTPVDGDVGNYLKVTAAYTDGHGPGKTANGVSANAVKFPNRRPAFADQDPNTPGNQNRVTLSVNENTAASTNIGAPFSASDADGDTLTYRLAGRDAASFRIVASSGQLQTRAPLDYERKASYSFVVRASDGSLHGDVNVTVNVINKDEAGAATLSSVQPQVGTPLTVTLTDPDGSISNRTWQWAQASSKSGSYTSISGATGASYTPASVNLGKYLRVTVSYSDALGSGKSAQVTSINATRAAPLSNRRPSFSSSTAARSVAENTAAGGTIGSPVTATDPDSGDALTYSLGGTDAASFRIAASSGQLYSRAPLDYENRNSYTVTVTAADPSGLSGDITVNISVTDANEPPGKPNAPTVTTASVNGHNDLGVAWAAPSNTGPAISGYDVEYRKQGVPAWDDSNLTASGTVATITGLTADSRYEARVRAKNAEGAGQWSDPGTGRTGITPFHLQRRLTAAFQEQTYSLSEGNAATITVTLNSPADRSLLIPITVARGSAEAGDYLLSGLSSSNLSLAPGDSSGGFTISAVQDSDLDDETLELALGTLPAKVTAGPSSTARVTITDDDSQGGAIGQGEGDDSDPPNWNNNPPEFTEGLSTERSVEEEAPPGTNIGLPVTARDEDQDPLTYSLSGFNGPYFDIESSTGQLKTKYWLNFETKNTYVVVVEASEARRGSDSIVVTINVTDIEGDADDEVEGVEEQDELPEATPAPSPPVPTATPVPAPVIRSVAKAAAGAMPGTASTAPAGSGPTPAPTATPEPGPAPTVEHQAVAKVIPTPTPKPDGIPSAMEQAPQGLEMAGLETAQLGSPSDASGESPATMEDASAGESGGFPWWVVLPAAATAAGFALFFRYIAIRRRREQSAPSGGQPTRRPAIFLWRRSH